MLHQNAFCFYKTSQPSKVQTRKQSTDRESRFASVSYCRKVVVNVLECGGKMASPSKKFVIPKKKRSNPETSGESVKAEPRDNEPGNNCIKIGLPGKRILSKRKGLGEVLFS